jgi:hypothetical protein
MPDLELPDMDATLGAAFDAAEDAPEVPEIDEAPVVETASSEDVTPQPEAVEAAPEPDEPAPAEPEVTEQPRSSDAIEQILAPRRKDFAMQGMDDATALNHLFALSDLADRDPQRFVQWFAQQRGLDMASLVPQPEPTAEFDEFTDPAITQAHEKIRQLEAYVQSFQAQQQQAQVREAQQAVESFSQQTDAQGNLAHPHYEAVKHQIAALLRSGVGSLQDAYEQACWSNPQVRGQLLKQQEAERLAQAKAAAAKAEKTAAQPRTPGGQFASQAPRSMEDTLNDVYDRMH